MLKAQEQKSSPIEDGGRYQGGMSIPAKVAFRQIKPTLRHRRVLCRIVHQFAGGPQLVFPS